MQLSITGRLRSVIESDRSLQAGRFAVPLQRLAWILGNAEAAFVEKTEVDLGAGVALFRRLPIPLGRRGVVRRRAQSLFVDFADVGLCGLVAFRRERKPDAQRSRIVGAIVGDVFSAPDLALAGRGLDGTPRGKESHLRAEAVHLARQQTVDG